MHAAVKKSVCEYLSRRVREARTRYDLACASVTATSLAFTQRFGKPDRSHLRHSLTRKMDSAADVLGVLWRSIKDIENDSQIGRAIDDD
jgi:hypothetical protein